MSYFQEAIPNIINNKYLREPQIKAYEKIFEHFIINKSNQHALVVLPTGTGKTGLMAISPYHISNGRVLIITPQTVIRDSVLGSLDPLYPQNFWQMTRVFTSYEELPTVIEYTKKLTNEVLQSADIVILNVQKLQERLDSSLIKRVDDNFFDFIIIDEAHHSTAKTWKRTLRYFKDAKVLKVTGTPFRTDGEKIEGEKIYDYGLGKAMANGFVKSLEKIDYIPDQLFLTLDGNTDNTYSLEEIRQMGIRDEEWISRSIALSVDCNNKIIDRSLELLREKREITKHPHKIIAVACSIWHAEQLKHLYSQKGAHCSIIHSELEPEQRVKEFSKIENNDIDVVINVAMLGEGYDHKFLSIAAIFRPFRHQLPYEQFVGRVLRALSKDDVSGKLLDEDNIASVIHHKELGLDDLWNSYKKEIKKRDIIKGLRGERNIDPSSRSSQDISFGEATESDDYEIQTDTFIDTELIKHRKEKQREEQKKIEELQKLLNIDRDKAKSLYQQSLKSQDKEKFLRPDLYLTNKKDELDQLIREEIIPNLLVNFDLKLHGQELIKEQFLLPRSYQNIYKNAENNGALLGMYFNLSLKRFIGTKRDEWKLDDFDRGINQAKKIEAFLQTILNEHFGSDQNE